MAKIGLVTVLYNSDEVLEDFFRTVSYQDYKNYELYIVDNSENPNTDELIITLSNKYPITAFNHIKTGGNVGVAAGNNIGIKQAIADLCSYVLILNNDIVIERTNCFSKMIELSKLKGEKIIVNKVLYYENRKVWMAGGYMDNFRALGVHYSGNDENSSKFNEEKYITYAPTCFLFVNSDIFKEIGIMDEKYFAYCDDTDFVYRCIQKDIKIFYEPSLTILHKVSSSSGGDASLFYIYYSNRNKIYFIRKHYKGIHKFLSLTYTLLARFVFYLKFNTAQKQKLIEAIKDGFKMNMNIEEYY
jgi:GT2 family glycosyltransferase